jgi:extracellular factor (EF) 3-hydroxypalmitic acid methyl ester biosynthesis protein
MNPLLFKLSHSLDSALLLLQNKSYHEAFEILGTDLSALWDEAVDSEMQVECRTLVRSHQVFALCQQDPYTRRAFSKPRGYAGDAVMLDYVYGIRPPENTTEAGYAIFMHTTRGSMGLSVSFRRALLAAYINDAIARNPRVKILSVASGHLREIEGTFVLHDAFKGTFTAFDQDSESCSEVERSYGDKVAVVVGSVKRLINRKYELGKFDLIYSAGLYDYLPSSLASKLTTTLISLLNNQGRLITANFSKNSHGRGYLDWIMDWQLIFRTKEEFATISMPEKQLNNLSFFADPHGNVIYSDFRSDGLR